MFDDTFMMQSNIQMTFHFLDKDMMTKTGISRSNMVLAQKACVEIRKNTKNCN